MSDDDDQSPQDERQRSRSRDRVHPYAQAPQTSLPCTTKYNQWLSKSHLQYLMKTLVALEDDKGPDRENEHLYMYLYITDDESAAVEPQSRVSRPFKVATKKRPVHRRQKGKKTTADVKKPSDLPEAKKHEPMDSDEDDEVPQNEPGTSSNIQPPVPVLVLPLQSGSTSSSHGPSTSTTSTRSQRTSTSTSFENASARQR